MIKLPKGTRDYDGDDYYKLEYLKNAASRVFRQFGGSPIETPASERTDLLTNKFGDEEKLIFNLEKDSNVNEPGLIERETTSLRYDQTIPFVRYVLCNGIDKMKRYSIGKVYRRESTNNTIKRLREFYQADFDFVGNYDANLPEIQIMLMINKFFADIGIYDYTIRYNFRQLLYYYVVDISGVNERLFKGVCTSLDKLEKIGWDEVTKELFDRGLTIEQIVSIKESIATKLLPEENFVVSIREFESLLDEYEITNCEFDTTLARGLDYYTGIIFEVTVEGFSSSVAGGGRYDTLIQKYDRRYNLPMIGFSFGLDRLLDLITYQRNVSCNTVVIFTIIQNTSEDDRTKLNSLKVRVIKELIEFNFDIEFVLNDKRARKQMSKIASDPKYIYAVIIGVNEMGNDQVSVKNLKTREQKPCDVDKLYQLVNNELFTS